MDICLQGLGCRLFSVLGLVSPSVQWGWVRLLSHTLSSSRIQRAQVPSPGFYNCLHREERPSPCRNLQLAASQAVGKCVVGVLLVEFGLLSSAELPHSTRTGIFLLYFTRFHLQQQAEQVEILFLFEPRLEGPTLLQEAPCPLGGLVLIISSAIYWPRDLG